MTTTKKRFILLFASTQLLLTVILLALPQILMRLPTRYQLVLADNATILEPVFAAIKTPLPNTLPVPSGALANTGGAMPILDFAPTATHAPTFIPTATSTPTPLFTTTPQPTTIETIRPTLTSTATPIPEVTPTSLPLPTTIPNQKTIADVHITRQNFNNCGPANLSIVLNYWGDDTTQLEAASFLKPNPEDRNVSPWQLSDYVNENTLLRSTVHSGGNIEMLRTFVAAGIPVIVEKGYIPSPDEGWLGHYLTVFGYDDTTRSFRSHDTYIGPFSGEGRIDSYSDLEKGWQAFNYTFFVIYRPDQEALVQSILGPDLVEPLKMWQQTALIAQSEIEADNENAFSWFNLGTSLTRLGELTGDNNYYQQGAAAFDQAFLLGIPPRVVWYQFRPYIAYMKTGRYNDMLELANSTLQTTGGRNVEETYLYKGHALAFLGDIAGAKTAYERGLELNRNAYPIQWALDSLQ